MSNICYEVFVSLNGSFIRVLGGLGCVRLMNVSFIIPSTRELLAVCLGPVDKGEKVMCEWGVYERFVCVVFE